jgi:hypothetical protein
MSGLSPGMTATTTSTATRPAWPTSLQGAVCSRLRPESRARPILSGALRRGSNTGA